MMRSDPVTFDALLRAAGATLAQKGIEQGSVCARQLMMAAAGMDKAALIAAGNNIVPDDVRCKFESYLEKRAAGMPVGRIIGEREFYGLMMGLAGATLEPRADSEILVDLVLRDYADASDTNLRFMDIGTGSGALAIAIAAKLAKANGIATDISGEAIETARQNAIRHGVDQRLEFVETNWCGGVEGKFDFIVSNPPYISSDDIDGLAREVKAHDPVLALDGGKDGLDAYRAIFRDCAQLLRQNGALYLEIGFDQAHDVHTLGAHSGWEWVATHRDYGDKDRVLVFIRC